MYIYVLKKLKIMKFAIYKTSAFIGVLLFLISCKVEPQAIEYGKEQCNFCSMTIVDKAHASQYVTTKGKQFKFDAIECLINDINNKNDNDIAVMLVANYNKPGEMINAKTASYLISEEIKSPMSVNLSAFSSLEKATEMQQKYIGDIYTWDSLKVKIFEIQ